MQLLGGGAGRKTVGLEQGYTCYQFEEASKSNKAIIQWRHPALDLVLVRDERYKAVVANPKVTVCGFEEFKATLLATARAEVLPSQTSDVFVNADRYNIAAAESVKGVLTAECRLAELPEVRQFALPRSGRISKPCLPVVASLSSSMGPRIAPGSKHKGGCSTLSDVGVTRHLTQLLSVLFPLPYPSSVQTSVRISTRSTVVMNTIPPECARLS